MKKEYLELQKKKSKRIIKGLLLLIIPLPLYIFIDSIIGYPNQFIEIIAIIITIACMFIGFFLLGITLVGYDPKNTHIVIAGKEISHKVIKNSKNMTFKQKMNAYNITGLLLKLLAIPCFFGLMFYIFEDPTKFFAQFNNTVRAQLYAVYIFAAIVNTIYLLNRRPRPPKHVYIIYIITCIIMFLVFYYITIPA